MLVRVGQHVLRLPVRASYSSAFLRESPVLPPPPFPPSGSSTVRHRSSGAADPVWYEQVAHSAPVRLAEDFLVQVQQTSGLPWWISIAVSTLGVRTLITLPLAVYQMRIFAKVEALQPEIEALAKSLRYHVSLRASERGWTDKQSRFQFQKNLQRLASQLYVRDNCHPMKASLLVWVQLPLWISLSLALRNLSLRHAELEGSLTTGGALWFPDLTLPDSTWLLPLGLGLTNLLIVELFSLRKPNMSAFHKVVRNGLRCLSVLMIPIAAGVPSAMSLYWWCSSVVGLAHNHLLRSPALANVFKVPTPPSNTPNKGLDLMDANGRKYHK
ncbi:LOW QUALITY PROTEIN: cytochrome c oxidase assembly protein COX18, mitochondrial [Festucalex cinctus]